MPVDTGQPSGKAPVGVLRRWAIPVLLVTLTGCVAGLAPADQDSGPVITGPVTTPLTEWAAGAAPTGPGESAFHVLDSGRDAFLARAALVEAAGTRIDAQYYIWNDDPSGRYLAARLLLAAERGVQVRLLLDDINVAGDEPLFAALQQHPNIQVRIFNPAPARDGAGRWLSFLSDFERLNRRMHNKTFVVDGAAGIVGGRNIGDEYFDLHPELNFLDRDVLAIGPVVASMANNFEAWWHSRWAYPLTQLYPEGRSGQDLAAVAQRLRQHGREPVELGLTPPAAAAAVTRELARFSGRMVNARGQLVFDLPFGDAEQAADRPGNTAVALGRLAQGAQEEVLIESAYLILTHEQLAQFDDLQRRDVRVAALTNSLASNDLVTNHSGYARWRPEMLRQGLVIHELRPDPANCPVWLASGDFCTGGAVGLHSKSAVFDRKIVVIGSFNVNLRSIFLNGETLLIIHSPELAGRLAQDIDIAMAPANSWHVRLDDDGELSWQGVDGDHSREPAVGWWRRFTSSLLALLPIEKYL